MGHHPSLLPQSPLQNTLQALCIIVDALLDPILTEEIKEMHEEIVQEFQIEDTPKGTKVSGDMS